MNTEQDVTRASGETVCFGTVQSCDITVTRLHTTSLTQLDTTGLMQAMQEAGRGFRAMTVALRAAVPLLAEMAVNIREADRMWREATMVEHLGVMLYRENLEGEVHVGDYLEDIDWFHGLLLLRYGAECVSPLTLPERGPRSFVFDRRLMVTGNPRWKMYCGID